MKKFFVIAGTVIFALFALAFFIASRNERRGTVSAEAGAATAEAPTPIGPPSEGTREEQPGFLYGRITTIDGATYQGRLRFGGGEEAFWSDYFNGDKRENPWVAQVPREKLPRQTHRLEIFGLKIAEHDVKQSFDRLFMARFGDITRIEARGMDVLVTLKSGTVFALERDEASDFDDGVRVWDENKGVVDLDSLRISTIELLPTAPIADPPVRLHGTVRTRHHADFTGFIQWDRIEGVGTDELEGHTSEGQTLSLRYDTIRSVERRSRGSAWVKLLDGREIELIMRQGDSGNRGLYVDDPRYGRVLITWDFFERLEFSPGDSGPAYDDFPPGRPLTGSVTTRDGRRLTGRLVYDLDESETTETLDAPSMGVDYTIPFAMIASIEPAAGEDRDHLRTRVTLHSGEELQLGSFGDLGRRNAGILVFVDGEPRPEYVPWADVKRIELARPPKE